MLDRTGEREQPLLDENGHFADEVHRLAALLEDTRVPFHAIGQFVDSALVGITSILNFAPGVISVPDGVAVRKVDLSIELQILSFYQHRNQIAHA